MTAVNYDDVVAQMRDAGLQIEGGPVINSPRTERVRVDGGDRERRGWYRLTTVDIDGETYIVGAFGIWHGNDNGKVSVRPGRRVQMSREQRAAIAERIAADAKRAKAQRAAQAERAAREAARLWRAYAPSGTSAYLDRKGVQAEGLRFHPEKDTVAIPMLDPKGKLWGVELIRGADRGDKLEKQYWPKGLDKVGHYHLIGGSPRDLLIITEGYATAWSLHEATGLPVATAFDAGNLLPVAKVLHKQYPRARILIGADDDYRTNGNPGIAAATNAALAVDGRWLAPQFSAPRAEQGRKGPTDWNDLHQLEGLHAVRSQVEGYLEVQGWLSTASAARALNTEGAGERAPMPPRLSVDEAAQRYWGTYGFGGKLLFDGRERRLVHKDDVVNLLPRHGWEALKEHPDWRVARDWEIGFDPAGTDSKVRCNLYAGWPTEPAPGRCESLLELLEYLCSGETQPGALYDWVLDWLAYPIQHPGAKMHSALVVHGPQGTGKSLFFETIKKIYGEYGRILGQEALEDKFNADWAEKKLFILADEVLARQDMWHVKNRLKSFITGDTIRVNPKGVAAHNEANHMNIVFLSNERMPVVLENDDRRHCIIWSPPKLPPGFFDEVVAEIDAGGGAALHHFLLNRDISHFTVASRPPMTEAKQDLIAQSASSEERFVGEWLGGEIGGVNGEPLPVCPCLGSDLYQVYRRWCERHGERPRRAQELIGYCGKRHGWAAGRTVSTWRDFQDKAVTKRKLVVPSAADIEAAVQAHPAFERHRRERYESATHWHTAGYFDFRAAAFRDPDTMDA